MGSALKITGGTDGPRACPGGKGSAAATASLSASAKARTGIARSLTTTVWVSASTSDGLRRGIKGTSGRGRPGRGARSMPSILQYFVPRAARGLDALVGDGRGGCGGDRGGRGAPSRPGGGTGGGEQEPLTGG